MNTKKGFKLALLILSLGVLDARLSYAADTTTTSTTPSTDTTGDKKDGPPHGHGHHHGPPPEAIAACKGKAAAAACTFTHHDNKTETGTCETPDSSKPLACRPAHGPDDKGPPGGPPPAE